MRESFLDKKQTLYIVLLSFTFLFCYWSTLTGLFDIWKTDEDYSYALLIPILTAYLIWERREEIKKTNISINWFGGALFALLLLISVYGILGSSPSAVRPAIPLVILSITLFCFGKQVFKILCFPLALLIFMIPLPTVFQTTIGNQLKLISTRFGELILRIFNIPAYVEGNVIDLGVTQLQVVDACSGLRYILPLLALGVIFAYFFEKNRWKQIVLVLATVPIAILTNGIRIGLTGILTQKYGASVAEGFFHGFSGWLIFMFAFVMLFLLYFLLRLIPMKEAAAKPVGDDSKHSDTDVALKSNIVPILITSILLISIGILGFTTSALPNIKIKGGISSFPLMLKDWNGKMDVIDPKIITESGAEEAFGATYVKGDEQVISLYMGYRGSPFNETENFFHSPTVCLPSSGWTTLSSDYHLIKDIPGFGVIKVRRMIIEKMGQKQMAYFWFQTKSRTSYNVNVNRFHLAMHAIKRDNTHDLFIRPIMPLRDGEKMEDAEKRMDQFVREMMAVLLEFLQERQFKART